MSARLRAAWARPPKASADEVADELRDVLRAVQDATATLVRASVATRDAIATLKSRVDDFDEVPRDFAARMVADGEVSLAALTTELDEDGPLGRVMKKVVEPYNDALRDYRRAVQEYLGCCRRMLASIEAHAAEDARVARAVMADDADSVVPWTSVRDNVRTIR